MNKHNTIVVSISGYKGTGKDTFAKLLATDIKNTIGNVNVYILPLAYVLKKIVKNALQIEYETIEELKRQENNKCIYNITMRDFLINMSEGIKSIYGKDFWIKTLWDKFNKEIYIDDKINILLIPDLRYQEEQSFLQSLSNQNFITYDSIYLKLKDFSVNIDHGENFYDTINFKHEIGLNSMDELPAVSRSYAKTLKNKIRGNYERKRKAKNNKNNYIRERTGQ